MRTRWLPLGVSIGVVALSGCETDLGTPLPNEPPETYLSITGSEVDTTFYVLDLSWWGSDVDGDVARYEFRWDAHWTPLPGDTVVPGTSWVATRVTRRQFLIEVGDVSASSTLTLRAIDDDGEPDPTPIVQTFHVRNQLPTVEFGDDLPRPVRSLPAVTFSLEGRDPDGDASVVGYRAWFEGQDPATEAVLYSGGSETHVTLPPSSFAGAGQVTVHFQALDETGAFGTATASHTWEVIPTAGRRALLVDHHPDNFFFAVQIDAFYRDAVNAHLGADAVALLKVGVDDVFRTEEEASLAFAPFAAVIWYGGIQEEDNENEILGRTGELRLVTGPIQEYVRQGGLFFLQSTYAFGNALGVPGVAAAWDSAGTHDLLGFSGFYRNAGGNTNFTLYPFAAFDSIATNPDLGLGKLRPLSILTFVEMSPLPAGAYPLAWMPPGSLWASNQVDNPVNYYCAFELPFPGGGRFTFVSFPLPRTQTDATAFLTAILTRFFPDP